MYKEGDTITINGTNLTVVPNHCGLPWVCGISGEYCGVIQLNGCDKFKAAIFCDAISGEELTTEKINNRLNNYDYDYENKSRDCLNWRSMSALHW